MRPLFSVLTLLALAAASQDSTSQERGALQTVHAESPFIELMRIEQSHAIKNYHPRSPAVRENMKNYCYCGTHLCGCCTAPATVFNVPLKGCVDFMVNSWEKAFHIRFSFMDIFSFDERLSTQGLDSVCTTVPSLDVLGYCFKTESTENNENGLTVCSSLEFQVNEVSVAAIRFSCLNLKNGHYSIDYPQGSGSSGILNIKVKNPLTLALELFKKLFPNDKKPDGKKDDVKPDPKIDDVKPDPKKDDVKPDPKKDDVKPDPKKDDVKPDPKKDDDTLVHKKVEFNANGKGDKDNTERQKRKVSDVVNTQVSQEEDSNYEDSAGDSLKEDSALKSAGDSKDVDSTEDSNYEDSNED